MSDDGVDVEGLDTSSEIETSSAYPLDDVMVRSETRTVSEVIKRINSDRYIMDPDFQRSFIWSNEKQSKLIESCVMRIPLPVLYVAEAMDGRVAVVDGLQRLSTFRRYLADGLRLTGLGKNHPLQGKLFSELPVYLRERIEDTQLTLYILDKAAPEVARLDIFERVNGGVPLTRQQMRNAIYNGKGTRFLAKMAENEIFLRVTGGSLNPKTMRDREAINRFAAFRILGWHQYESGDMDEYLASGIRKMNSMENGDLENLEHDFLLSMSNNERLFGRHSFRKSLRGGSEEIARSVINISLFDVLSVKLSSIEEEYILMNSENIIELIEGLINDEEFNHFITYSTNSTYQVRMRFDMVDKAFMELPV